MKPLLGARVGGGGPDPAWLYQASRILVRPFRWFWRMRTVGGESVAPSGALLLAANHTSYLDPWFLGATFPRSPIRFVINEPWYTRSAPARFLFRRLHVLPTSQGDPEATIRRILGALDRGEIVGIFPEGGISRDGRPMRARSGIGHIAARSGVPVVPCGLRGAFESLPRHRRIPRRCPVLLHVGPPLRFEGSPIASPTRAATRAFADAVMDEVRRLSGHIVGPTPSFDSDATSPPNLNQRSL